MNIHQKLVEIRKDIGGFTKDAQGYGYQYVSGSQVLSKIQDKMNELGVLLVPKIINQQFEKHDYVNSKGKSAMDFLVYGEMTYTWINAENPEDFLEVPFYYTGAQDDISKAFGSGLTYSERYFIIKFFNLPTDADDPDKRDTSGRSRSTGNGGNSNTGQSSQEPQNPSDIVLTFGKHSGKSLGQLMQEAPDYVEWLSKNAKGQDVKNAANVLLNQQRQASNYQQGTDNNVITQEQLKALHAAISSAAERTITNREAVIEYAKTQMQIPLDLSSKQLTSQQASQMIDFINQIPSALEGA